MGLRLHGLLPAIIIPMFLTMVLFLGPLSMQGLSGLWKLYAGMSAFKVICMPSSFYTVI